MNTEKLWHLIRHCERAFLKSGFRNPGFRSITYEHDRIVEHFKADNFAAARKFVKVLGAEQLADHPPSVIRVTMNCNTSRKKYILFQFNDCYPSGGVGDIQKDFDTISEAKDYIASSCYDNSQLINRDTWEEVDL